MTLLEIEKERKKIINKIKSAKKKEYLRILFALITFDIFSIFMAKPEITFNYIFSNLCFILFLGVLYYFGVYFKKDEEIEESGVAEYKEKFKNYYFKEFLEKRGFSYSLKHKVNGYDIKISGLFGNFAKIYGEDLIIGRTKRGVSFAFSDIMTVNNAQVITFQGIFFMADFKKNITSNTYILKKNRANFNKTTKKVMMDNAKFNTYFSVYSDDIKNAMYIITPLLMEKMVNLVLRFGRVVEISFVYSKIYIAVKNGIDNFEPNLRKSAIRDNPASRILGDLRLFLGWLMY